MIRIWDAAGQLGGHDEVLLAEREEAAAHHARQLGPADQRDDDGDREVDLEHAPGVGRAAARPIHKGMVGIERRISITRWMTVSAMPP
jgi:hypothetical protein